MPIIKSTPARSFARSLVHYSWLVCKHVARNQFVFAPSEKPVAVIHHQRIPPDVQKENSNQFLYILISFCVRDEFSYQLCERYKVICSLELKAPERSRRYRRHFVSNKSPEEDVIGSCHTGAFFIPECRYVCIFHGIDLCMQHLSFMMSGWMFT